MKRNTRAAFLWIIDILEKNNIPFQITGGFAARVYGAKRRLADIDIDIPEIKFRKLLPSVKAHRIFGPKRYRDKTFDVLLITLIYAGQKIDISGCESEKYYDRKQNRWVRSKGLSHSVKRTIYGKSVPVIPLENLIKYKSQTLRGVDKKDLDFINRK